jgi:para-nitrobenzyl esterase
VLNVYSPAADDRRRPVVVWIHGGAFIMGSGSQPLYNGSAFAVHHDVVVVTINYRLGVFGFLYLGELAGEPYRAGNVALLDQLAALRWVRDHIAAFGGDPARVTVMGESAGAVSIGTLLGVPAARGLFHRAILQSGASGLVPPVAADATDLAKALLGELGVEVAGLADVPADRLIAAQERTSRERGLAAFTPFVDGVTIVRPPTEAARDSDGPQVPVLLGSNRDEWTFFDVFLGEAATGALRGALIGRLGEAIVKIHAAYRDARTDRSDAAAWVDVIGEVAFRIPMIRLAEAIAPRAPVWMYRFDWASTAFDGRLGSAHALELPFVWDRLELPISQFLLGGEVEAARPLAAAMHAAWGAFVRGDEPSAEGLPAWPRYDAERRATMILDRAPRIEDDPAGALRRLWVPLTAAPR